MQAHAGQAVAKATQPGALSWILRTLVITLLMWLVGLLAGMMSISAELQSFIWLPSGVGLAVALWFGLAALPGILLGGGVIGWSFASGQGVAITPAMIITFSSALGAMLEAHIGRLLVLRFINHRAEIETGTELLRLLVMAPVIALLNPSVVVAVQSLGQVGLWADYPALWRNMWLAGALAIAFLTPLLLALRYRKASQIAVLGGILVAGTWLSYQLVVSSSRQAHEAWEALARDEASQLTGIFGRALENGFGDIRAIAVLLGGDDDPGQEAFQSAVDTLHATSAGFVPAALVVVTRNGNGDWIVRFSSDTEFGLVAGYNMSTIDVALDAIESSLERGLVLGATTELVPGEYFGMNAIPVPGRGEPMVVVGLQDVGEIDRIVAEQLTLGLGFAISSVHASGLTTEGRDHHYPEGKSSKDAVATFSIPLEIAGATLLFQWGVVEEYKGGPALEFSRAIFFGGPLITLLIAVSLNVLFAQAGRIRREVEQKTSELKKQTSIANQALENMGEGILLVGRDGRIAAYNEMGAEYFGLTDEEIARYPVYEDLLAYLFLEKYDQPENYEQRMRELRDNKAIQVDRELPNGKILEVRHRPIADGGFVRMFLDVTENRKAAEELKRQTTIANMALENMDEGLLLIDAEDRPAAVNQIALDMFHLTREEFDACETHEDLIRLVHTEKLKTPELIDQMLEEVHSQQPYASERTRQDGRIIETRHMPMADGGCVRMYTDVTESRRTAAALEEQKAIADLALQNMDEGLLLVDGEGLIKAWNDVALEIFRIDGETISRMGRFDRLLHHLLEGLGAMESYEHDLAEAFGNKPFVIEQLVPNGTLFEIRHIPIEGGGFVRIMSDITQRRAQEEELIAARQVAEDSARSKAEFLANMSHEIRTPMNAIIGMSHLALKTELTPKQHNYVDKVHRSAIGLLGIINDILDFSKIEAGKLELETVEFRLEDVLDNLVNLVGLRAEEKGLELLLHVDSDVPRLLVGDPLRLGQVLVNLGNNAVKFTDAGEVVVTVRALEQTDDKVRLHFSVKDTGIGMTVEEKARLFRAFSQADASTTRKFGGTGLGLTISKRLVDAMNGDIGVDSKPDMGSDFHFDVELGWKESGEQLPRADELDLHGLRVLVVDDNPTARDIFEELVVSLGFRVDLAASGEEAMGLVARAREEGDAYSVILMDWRMPGLDGVGTTRALVEDGLLDETQALMMVTAYGREEAASAGAGLPISHYLTKPLNASTLLDSILLALGREAISQRRLSQADEQGEAARKLAGAHVLLVEDNEINQELALELLTGAGIVVDVANNGAAALESLKANNYDGVLMDIQMPVMDGYTAAEKIRGIPEYSELPVIAMTANALVGDRERALEAGMNDHIAKPLNVADMFATMAKWITPSDPARRPGQVADQHAEPDGLPTLDGVDTAAGLATCAGNHALYVKLLLKFVDSNAAFEQDFLAAQSSDEGGAAVRCAHTLKGVAANIGARGVSEAAAGLESACREGAEPEVIEACLRAVVKCLEIVLASISNAVLGDQVEAGASAGDAAEVASLVAELRPLLEAADTRAGQLAEQLLASLVGDRREPVERLIAQLEQFDFDAALAIFAEAEPQLLEMEDT